MQPATAPRTLRGMPAGRGVPERFLTTVVMTDIVGSTEHAAELGDSGWRELVQLHHALVRAALRRHRGREIDTAGDGFFATFDAPAEAVDCALEIAARCGRSWASRSAPVSTSAKSRSDQRQGRRHHRGHRRSDHGGRGRR